MMGDTPAKAAPRDSKVAQGDNLRRRKVAQNVRSAREKLTSSVGLERSFEAEFLRLFAQYRIGAAIPLLVLTAAVGGAANVWIPIEELALPLALVAVAMAIIIALAHSLLRHDETETLTLASWHRIFVVGEALQAAAWALLVQSLMLADPDGARSFVLFVVLMVSAVTAMLSATLPAAVYAGLLPLSAVVTIHALEARSVDATMLAAMTISAQVFFVFLARRLYTSAMAALHSRAEKDKLFLELEEAKANSDEARRRAEEANLAKSRFLATMSHELRTPLNAILGFSEVMTNEVFGAHASDNYQEYSPTSIPAGSTCSTLINEILDLSRIEAGRYELKEEPLELDLHRRGMPAHDAACGAKAKQQTVKAIIEPALPRIWADERAVRQIVLNILSNAVKFTPPGGEIVIKAGWTASGGQYCRHRGQRPGHSRGGDPDRHVVLRPGLDRASRAPNRAPASACRSCRGWSNCMAAGSS